MAEDTGKKAIDLFVGLAAGASTIEFVFTGGEPLLERITLDALMSYASERAAAGAMRPQFVLKTNGILVDDSIAEMFATYDCKVVVSIDGAPDTHDQHRVLPSGARSQRLVEENLVRLLRRSVRCVASVTVHPDAAHMACESVKYLHALGVTCVDVGPAYGTVTWCADTVDALTTSLGRIAEYMRAVRCSGRELEVGPIYRFSEHVDGHLRDCWGCGAVSKQLAVMPDGRLTGCSALAMLVEEHPELCVGDVWRGTNDEAVSALSSLAQAGLESRPLCHGCSAADDCTGGCLAINLAQHKRWFDPPPFYCQTIAAIPAALRTAWHEG